MFDLNPVPKPKKKEKTKTLNLKHRRKKKKNWRHEWGILSHHDRHKPKWKEHGRVIQDVASHVWYRDGGRCQRCGAMQGELDRFGFPKRLEIAHLHNRSQMGSGEPDNLTLLCGPVVNSDSCHHWADSTAEGRRWKEKRRAELMKYYGREGIE